MVMGPGPSRSLGRGDKNYSLTFPMTRTIFLIAVSVEGAFMRRLGLREAAGVSVCGSQPQTGTDAGLRPAALRPPARSMADGASLLREGFTKSAACVR